MRFCRSTHLLICLSLETLTSIIRTSLPILVKLRDLVNSVIISFVLCDLSQMVKVACRVQIWKKHFVKIVTILVTVLLKMTLGLCI